MCDVFGAVTLQSASFARPGFHGQVANDITNIRTPRLRECGECSATKMRSAESSRRQMEFAIEHTRKFYSWRVLVTHDTPSDVARLQMIGYYPQSERSSKDLFSIDLAEHGGIRRATHTSGDRKIANCSVELQDDKGMLILTCESGYPPRLSFLSISRNEVRFQFLGPLPHHHAKYVPYLSATAHRHRNSTNH
jgi:hypothetical protein